MEADAQLDQISKRESTPDYLEDFHSLPSAEVELMLNTSREHLVALCYKLNLDPDRLSYLSIRYLAQAMNLKFPQRPQRIGFMMCKGGVGKTTSCFFIAQRLVQYGARVLVVDTDPQGNLTAALLRMFRRNTEISDTTPVIMDVLAGRCEIKEAIWQLSPRMHLIPSTALNSLLERELLKQERPVLTFHEKLLDLEKEYDFILIDSAPALNLINAAIMYASDRLLLPLIMSEFSIMGLEQTLREVSDLQRNFRFSAKVSVLVNKYDPEESIGLGYLGLLVKSYREYLMKAVIRSSEQIQRATATGRTLSKDEGLLVKNDYDLATREILGWDK